MSKLTKDFQKKYIFFGIGWNIRSGICFSRPNLHCKTTDFAVLRAIFVY